MSRAIRVFKEEKNAPNESNSELHIGKSNGITNIWNRSTQTNVQYFMKTNKTHTHARERIFFDFHFMLYDGVYSNYYLLSKPPKMVSFVKKNLFKKT